MNKDEFLTELERKLADYPFDETKASIEYYGEMIDDRMEDGMQEGEAVASLGRIDEIADRIKVELPLTTLVKMKTKEKTKGRRIPVWVILLLVLGFPLWGSLCLAIIAMLLSFYAAIWAVDIAFWAVCISLLAMILPGMVGFFACLFRGSVGSAFIYLGSGLACAGLGIFLFIGMRLVTKGICRGTGWCYHQIKKSLVRKEEQ